jgi:predicted AlkP superfamily phosphohydrolase/phosphomutase
MLSRRNFLKTTLAATLAAPCAATAQTTPKRRVIILGFDGVEPTIVDAMLSAGELPNLAKLRDSGCYDRLGSACPPQSPTAWSSFATCTNPGNHGIYDFIRRSPKNYMPGLGFGMMSKAELNTDGTVAKPAAYASFRKGKPFWRAANEQGARCKLLTIPYASPPDDLTNSLMLCGLDIPDIRGTQSSFFAFSDLYTAEESVPGGMKIPLSATADTTELLLPAFKHKDAAVTAPVKFTVDRQAHTLAIQTPSKTIALKQGDWSEWVEWKFDVTPRYSVQAISRFNLIEAGEHVRLYMTCLQMHPRAPLVPISTPGGYAATLADKYGLFKTIGWAYDTKAIQQDIVSDNLFLQDEAESVEWNRRLLIDELKLGGFDLLIGGWTATDRTAHLFWRFRDPKHPLYTPEGAKKYGRQIELAYIEMDKTVGEVLPLLEPDDLLIVMSDHGFKSFRTAFSLNTWLVRNGYLAVKDQNDPATAATDEKYLMGFDWPRTKAYGLGLGSLYLNIQGREGSGTVKPQDAPALLEEIKQKLLAVTDPATGEKVFNAIYTQPEVYTGISQDNAPDIQLGYNDGYQTSKASAGGAAPKDVFAPNDDKWSAEHGSADYAITPGIIFSNKRLANGDLTDLGVTTLAYLGLQTPPEYEGKSLLP